MRIIRQPVDGKLLLVPRTKKEAVTVSAIKAVLLPGQTIEYDSKKVNNKGEVSQLYLYAGARREERTFNFQGITVHRNVFVGGVKLVLKGALKSDKEELGAIRDMCFFGSSGLVFLGTTKIGGVESLITTGAFCKKCQHPMITMRECEHMICDADVARCDHKYERSPIHGAGIDIRMGEACIECGQVKPLTEEQKNMSALDQALEVERELGVTIIFDNLGISAKELSDRLAEHSTKT